MDDAQQWRTLIDGVREGEPDACNDFWNQYGPLIERVADKHIASGLRRRVGPESVMVSACRTFFRRAQQGEFEFADADAVWRLLCAITVTKVREKARFHGRQKRGLDREVHIDATDSESRSPEVVGSTPSPAEIAEFNDELQHLIASLSEEEANVLDLKLQQLTNDEIAERLQCSERTVRRITKRIQSHLFAMVAG